MRHRSAAAEKSQQTRKVSRALSEKSLIAENVISENLGGRKLGKKSQRKMTSQTLKERIEAIAVREAKQRKDYNERMKRICDKYGLDVPGR